MDAALDLLLVEDDEDDYILIRELLSEVRGQQYRIDWAATYQEASDLLGSKSYDVVLVDYDLGAKNGVQLIREADSSSTRPPFIMVTGRGSYEKDVEAMQAGASDYLTKVELSAPLLERSIRYAIDRFRIEDELERRVLERTAELQNALEELQVMEEEQRAHVSEVEEALGQIDVENHRYKDLFDQAPVAYLVTDYYGAIREANITAQELLHRQKESIVGKPLVVFIAQEHKSGFRNLLIALYREKKRQEQSLMLKPNVQEPFEAHFAAAPVWGKDGRLREIYWLIIPRT
jgi:DNA-binding response OmpR family regulator